MSPGRMNVVVTTLATLATVSACHSSPTGPKQGPAPTMMTVSPTTGTVGTELRVGGMNFRSGATVQVGDFSAAAAQVSGDTAAFALVPSGVQAGSTYSVKLSNSDGSSVTLPNAFEAVAPTLRFMNSATKPSGNTGSTVIVEGDAFGDVQGPGQVLFSDGAGGTVAAAIAQATDWTNTFIVTTVPAGAATGPVAVMTGTGTSDSLPFTVTQNATLSPSTIHWTQTQDLPAALSGHRAQFVPIDDSTGTTVQYVYVSGGAGDDSLPVSDVNMAVIQQDGSLGSWSPVTALPVGRAFHRMVAATPFNSKVQGSGYLYAMGGIETKNEQPTTTVYRAQLNRDGTLGSWTEVTSLPAPLHSFGAVLFRSAIYIAGGATTDNAPTASVYRATIDTLGDLSDWQPMPDLPGDRAYFDFQTFGGYLYAVGGDTAAVDPNDGNYTGNSTKLSDVIYAKIDLRSGDVGAWTLNTSAMQKARSKHSALVAGGTIFVSAGLYAAAGTGSSENSYAQINSDGSVGSFAGATGSNTLQSVTGVNLFNHAALAYVDAAGVAHVMILGGDDVNAPGNKQAAVLFY
jgi:hypothetical protein